MAINIKAWLSSRGVAFLALLLLAVLRAAPSHARAVSMFKICLTDSSDPTAPGNKTLPRVPRVPRLPRTDLWQLESGSESESSESCSYFSWEEGEVKLDLQNHSAATYIAEAAKILKIGTADGDVNRVTDGMVGSGRKAAAVADSGTHRRSVVMTIIAAVRFIASSCAGAYAEMVSEGSFLCTHPIIALGLGVPFAIATASLLNKAAPRAVSWLSCCGDFLGNFWQRYVAEISWDLVLLTTAALTAEHQALSSHMFLSLGDCMSAAVLESVPFLIALSTDLARWMCSIYDNPADARARFMIACVLRTGAKNFHSLSLATEIMTVSGQTKRFAAQVAALLLMLTSCDFVAQVLLDSSPALRLALHMMTLARAAAVKAADASVLLWRSASAAVIAITDVLTCALHVYQVYIEPRLPVALCIAVWTRVYDSAALATSAIHSLAKHAGDRVLSLSFRLADNVCSLYDFGIHLLTFFVDFCKHLLEEGMRRITLATRKALSRISEFAESICERMLQAMSIMYQRTLIRIQQALSQVHAVAEYTAETMSKLVQEMSAFHHRAIVPTAQRTWLHVYAVAEYTAETMSKLVQEMSAFYQRVVVPTAQWIWLHICRAANLLIEVLQRFSRCVEEVLIKLSEILSVALQHLKRMYFQVREAVARFCSKALQIFSATCSRLSRARDYSLAVLHGFYIHFYIDCWLPAAFRLELLCIRCLNSAELLVSRLHSWSLTLMDDFLRWWNTPSWLGRWLSKISEDFLRWWNTPSWLGNWLSKISDYMTAVFCAFGDWCQRWLHYTIAVVSSWVQKTMCFFRKCLSAAVEAAKICARTCINSSSWVLSKMKRLIRKMFECLSNVLKVMLKWLKVSMGFLGEVMTSTWCISCGVLLAQHAMLANMRLAILLGYAACSCIAIGITLAGRTARRWILAWPLTAIGRSLEKIGALAFMHVDFLLTDLVIHVLKITWRLITCIFRIVWRVVELPLHAFEDFITLIWRCAVRPAFRIVFHIWSYPVVWWIMSASGLIVAYCLHAGLMSPEPLYNTGILCHSKLVSLAGAFLAPAYNLGSYVLSKVQPAASSLPGRAAIVGAVVDTMMARPLALLISPTFGSCCGGAFILTSYTIRRLSRDLQLNEDEQLALAVRFGRSAFRMLFTIVTAFAVVLLVDNSLLQGLLKQVCVPFALIYIAGGLLNYVAEVRTWRRTSMLQQQRREQQREAVAAAAATRAAATSAAAAAAAVAEQQEAQSSTPAAEPERPAQPLRVFAAEECSICLEAFDSVDDDDQTVLRCGHTLHTKCALDWLKNSPTCPICRERVDRRGILRQKIF
eukprot:TRINITY_DN6658_c0_g1_i1.p1 TRINITY_DN6658_c0_g1~~TRINITY_DN6658_c0_g1_i1.p1  ORF type:complete len:1313 (+),score=173.24 TRINITY_DN6658_c0_g1_i1:66-4004(+)